jgi:hypothetical protein
MILRVPVTDNWGIQQKLCHIRGEFNFKQDYVNKTRMVIVGVKFVSSDFFTSVWWIRIQIRMRKNPKIFAGFGSVTWGYGSGSGSGSETGDAPYQKSSENHQKISNLIIVTLKKRKSNIFFKKYALKCHENSFFLLLALWKKEFL